MNYGQKQVQEKHKQLVSTSRKFSTKLIVNSFKAMLFMVVVCIVLVGFTGLGMIKGIIDTAPSVDEMSYAPSGYATTVYDNQGNELTKLKYYNSNRESVSISEIPECLQNAFIDIEDERFREHNGIDFKGILRAGFVALSSRNLSEGASTITQQLLKNNVFENGGRETTLGSLFKRKIQEQYLAIQLEKVMDKQIILEYYLNTISLGAGTYGVQAASKYYFNKDVSELNISESAVIAAITQNPTKYNPARYPENNAERRKKILGNMKTNKHITNAEYQAALEDDVYSRIEDTVVLDSTGNSSPYTYFVDELVNRIINDLMDQKGYTYNQAETALFSGGLSIYTTQDTAIQKICDQELRDNSNYPEKISYSIDWKWSVKHKDGTIKNYSNVDLIYYHKELLGNSSFKLIFDSEDEAREFVKEYKKNYFKKGDEDLGENLILNPQPQVSFTVIDQSTGEVKAIVGGRGKKPGSLSLNRATDTKRQPGSCFKVVSTYAPALDMAGYTLASVQNDEPTNYSNGRPVNNWNNAYKGPSSMRLGISNSMNVVTVKFMKEITPQLGFDYLTKNFGFTTLVESQQNADGTYSSDINEAMALGGITNGVTNLELCAAYATIANSGVYIEPTLYTKVLDSNGKIILEPSQKTHNALKDSTAWLLTNAMHDVVITGTGQFSNLPNQYVAGKTGTTTKNVDIWFSGYTPYLTATIWAGYDENQSLTDTSFHNKLWSKIMTRIHDEFEYTYKEFEMPDSVTNVGICRSSGKIPVNGLCNIEAGGGLIKTEYFAQGTEPKEACHVHNKKRATICTESNAIAGENCPQELREDRGYQVGDTSFPTETCKAHE